MTVSLNQHRSVAAAFVGRQQEMGELQAALDDSVAGRGRLVLLTGEAGIGKTRTAEEFAGRLRRQGLAVAVGRCHEGGGAPAYWPWLQVVRTCALGAEPAALSAGGGDEAATFAQLVPGIRDDPTNPALLSPTDSEQARFRLFEAIVGFFKNAAAAAPLVVLLDDLHAADKPSLLLLRFLTRQMAHARLLVVGAYRDSEVTRAHPLFHPLGDLAREPVSRRLTLRGLSEEEVARYIEIAAGSAPSESLASAVARKTEGNPLFLSEFVRLITAQGQLPASRDKWHLTIPDGVREVIGRRLDRLSSDCYEVLATASVIGREFALNLLERVLARATAPLLALIDEAASARIIGEIPGVIGHYRFAHTLIQETLYADLALPQRLELHRRIGEAIEVLTSADAQMPLAQLAHHFFRAAPGGGADKAVEYAKQAAERAAALLAFEEAVSHYERALQALEWETAASSSERALLRCELLVALGKAEMRAGETAKARETFQGAAELARRWHAPEWLARAALGLGAGFAWFWGYGAGTLDDVLVKLLREALDVLGPNDSALRVSLLSRLAVALYWSTTDEQRAMIAPLSEQAIAMARRLGDPSLQLSALASSCWANWRPDNVEERLAAASDIVRLAPRVGDRATTLLGHEYRIVYLLELGHTAAADREIGAFDRLANDLGQPCYQWYTPMFRANRAMMSGRFAEAERLIEQALDIGRRAASETVMQACASHVFGLRREQGRVDELEAAIRGFVQQYPAVTAWRCGLAALHMDLGDADGAKAQFEPLASSDFADLARDNVWLVAVTTLAEVCAFLDDARRARFLYELLLPCARLNVVAGVGFFSTGAVSRYLGLLAATMSRRQDAARHFEEALSLNRRMAASPFVAHTLAEYGGMLLNDREQHEGGRRLLEEADELAQGLQMIHLTRSIRARSGAGGGSRVQAVATEGVRAETGKVPPRRGRAATVLTLASRRGGGRRASAAARAGFAEDRCAEDEASSSGAGNSIRRRGEYWSISYEGRSFLLKDAKGLHYLVELLRRPAQEVHALELMAAIAGDATLHVVAESVGQNGPERLVIARGDAGEVLDRRATMAYRIRLRELREELDEARRFNDLGRIDKAQREADFVTRELARAVGIGGRHRHSQSATERARMSVTRSIRLVLRKLGEHDPALGRHLASTVKTGNFCCYTPDPRVPISWLL